MQGPQQPASVGVIGVPTSAGAFAAGQDGAPAALRRAGLLLNPDHVEEGAGTLERLVRDVAAALGARG
jgi:arginase family enzyme